MDTRKPEVFDQLKALLKVIPNPRMEAMLKGAQEEIAREYQEQKKVDRYSSEEKRFDLLLARGCPESIIHGFKRQCHHFSKVTQSLNLKPPSESNYYAIPVIPFSWRSLPDLLSMVRNGEEKSEFDPFYATHEPFQVDRMPEISDTTDTPKRLYYIYDVEDGTATLGKEPEKVVQKIEKEGRIPLTLCEIIALATHTSVLLHHGLWAADSRGPNNLIPALFIRHLQPKNGWFSGGQSLKDFGIPSCSRRIVVP